uniref:PLA2c domain-containing protein n=1 Tax=Chromera velia CCMP2878 TaxID=1169474 RepID=A0A0G4FU63_9ALVE|eukprot:Cvel_18701.t1-p1 / transcript=Cvel_18701.t1 / gene=Cvel_18701 / organism=Chromera_velia_CCMP2878 / gene_product=hypothetical protein / transcript_product=hypothetical protein / location=Cvel_scaffold1566:27599-33591(+) / protein_length=753 / sequence_SO=supercontig / SO=protein_coding / is_pseudo=false
MEGEDPHAQLQPLAATGREEDTGVDKNKHNFEGSAAMKGSAGVTLAKGGRGRETGRCNRNFSLSITVVVVCRWNLLACGAFLLIGFVVAYLHWWMSALPLEETAVLNGVTESHVWAFDGVPLSSDFPELSQGPFGIPSLQEKPSFGVALSGGGYRSCALASGWMRALSLLGVLQKVRYASTTSGSSWWNGAFAYSDVESDEFFSTYLQPEQLSVERILRGPDKGSFEAAIANGSVTLKILKQYFADALRFLFRQWDEIHLRAWSEGIHYQFLQPLGLDSFRAVTSAEGTRGGPDRLERLAESEGLRVFKSKSKKPFPIITGSVRSVRDPSGHPFFAFEHTPLYNGVPFEHPDGRPIGLGAGFVDPLGFNSEVLHVPEQLRGRRWGNSTYGDQERNPSSRTFSGVSGGGAREEGWRSGSGRGGSPSRKQRRGEKKRSRRRARTGGGGDGQDSPSSSTSSSVREGRLVVKNRFVVPLAEYVGISSAYMMMMMKPEREHSYLYGATNLHYFNLKDFKAEESTFGDGGGQDYYGLFSLLRRKTKFVIVFDSKMSPLEREGDDPSELAAFFGASLTGSGDIGAKELNKASQVFEREEWEALKAELWARAQTGGAVYARRRLKVVSNLRFQGIEGGWECELLFVLNSVNVEFERRLPRETRTYLRRERNNWRATEESYFGRFLAHLHPFMAAPVGSVPHTSTMYMNFPGPVVQLMTHMASFTLLSLKETVWEMVAQAEAERRNEEDQEKEETDVKLQQE